MLINVIINLHYFTINSANSIKKKIGRKENKKKKFQKLKIFLRIKFQVFEGRKLKKKKKKENWENTKEKNFHYSSP